MGRYVRIADARALQRLLVRAVKQSEYSSPSVAARAIGIDPSAMSRWMNGKAVRIERRNWLKLLSLVPEGWGAAISQAMALMGPLLFTLGFLALRNHVKR